MAFLKAFCDSAGSAGVLRRANPVAAIVDKRARVAENVTGPKFGPVSDLDVCRGNRVEAAHPDVP